MMEIKARQGPILAFAPHRNRKILSITPDVIHMPDLDSDPLAPIAYSVATQLFAYYIARSRGTQIDTPRNLAKSVTVE
ncbi:MAG: hypothetical protein A3F09_04940 [Chlamydiae bacterium RIFCSPHIGHO2_12_FULL_49_11]|nr:MAG: hypothetical protein A3F09_04940 [Chlamydiae bacterium RIFCSPHIGHO2_12_FULL_49_11]